VTEIPEHLLRRSKERRAALSGEGGAEPTTAEPESGTAQAAAVVTETPSAGAVVPAGGAPETQAGGGAAGGRRTGVPTVAEPAPAPRIGPTRGRIPIWIMPVLVALPLWGIVYLGAFGSRVKANANDPVTKGGTLFATSCSSCHGSNGEGGVGPQLNGGEVLKVWPNIKDHLSWVKTGGAPFVGKTIGAINIPVPPNNVMPAFGTAFGGALTDDQVAQVVCYERVAFGGEKESLKNCPGFEG
jgi:mono/diheme cytochrome c family protein